MDIIATATGDDGITDGGSLEFECRDAPGIDIFVMRDEGETATTSADYVVAFRADPRDLDAVPYPARTWLSSQDADKGLQGSIAFAEGDGDLISIDGPPGSKGRITLSNYDAGTKLAVVVCRRDRR